MKKTFTNASIRTICDGYIELDCGKETYALEHCSVESILDNNITIKYNCPFKNGDYINAYVLGEWVTLIVKEYTNNMLHYYVTELSNGNISKVSSFWSVSWYLGRIKLASKEDINRLNAKLVKAGKIWNSETKQIENNCRFKSGDILQLNDVIFTFKEYTDNKCYFYNFITKKGECCDSSYPYWAADLSIIEHATDEQLELWYQYWKERNVIWDSKKCQFVSWIPKYGEQYYFINSAMRVDRRKRTESWADDDLVSIGNCFPTQKLADEKAEQIKIWLKLY